MELDEYFTEIVEPTIAEFAANPPSRRHAFLACVTTFHAIDYLAASGKTPNRQNLRGQFRKGSTEFGIIDRVAHAFKHVQIDGHPNNPANQPLAVGEVLHRPPGIWGEARWGVSRWGDPVGGVTLDQERAVDLLHTIKAAAQFIQAQSRITDGQTAIE
jgi:hypothetical protein